MTRRMLIDGNHPEEIRVVILNGNRLEDYDIETSTKTQLKGNIYLAKVTRVEPSLQAAFVDYGGNRHGFLAFSEIHPDYYQIPIEDREALKRDLSQLADNAQAAQAHVEEMDEEVTSGPVTLVPVEDGPHGETVAAVAAADRVTDRGHDEAESHGDRDDGDVAEPADAVESAGESPMEGGAGDSTGSADADGTEIPMLAEPVPASPPAPSGEGGRRRRPPRRYRIQEVIKRRQILLVQVVKEERGNKGAALTTYLSLAGRYCVLMPNAARVGGVSRKITSASDRRRLRDLINSLDVPEGMGVIMRTAGMERTKAEIKRDLDYLLRLWEDVRELTLGSTAPALVYEEGNLIKRAIRDLYARDIEEVLVEGSDAYQTAKKFMRLMMPSHAKRVKQYRDPTIPLFHRYQVESQLEAMHSPAVTLKSGGYIVINPTEALVAIDVNSGRATRERNIEETAVKTNLEAASEIARQLRLRDLAGLIVIDFIDMEENRNQRAVEKRIKESVKTDRARIQLGRISPFGLFELSRQRLRPSLIETSTEICPRCHGIGHIRSTESTAIRVLRALEEEGIRRRTAEVTIEVATPIALYILNQKRSWLAEIERRYAFSVKVTGDDTLVPPEMRLERTRARTAADEVEHPLPPAEIPPLPLEIEIEPGDEEEAEAREEAVAAEPREQREGGGRRRRRRRRRKDGGELREPGRHGEAELAAEPAEPLDTREEMPPPEQSHNGDTEQQDERSGRRRRRGRRGGRRRRGERSEDVAAPAALPLAAERQEPDETQTEFWPGPTDAGETARERDNGERDVQPAPERFAELESVAQPEPAPEPEPVADDHAPAASGGNGGIEPESEPAPAEPPAEPEPPKGPPRRGWWQRMTESR